MKNVNCKIVILDGYVRIETYGKSIKNKSTSYKIKRDIDNPSLSTIEKISQKKKNRGPKVRRLTRKEQNMLHDLIDINFEKGHLFITLTFSKQDIGVDESQKHFENWIKRMRERYGDFKYLGVRSFQKRGTLHYHLLTTLPRIPKEEVVNGSFQEIWGHGTLKFKKIYRLYKGVRNDPFKKYMVKNMAEFKSDERSFGKRLLLKSKNLIEPTTIKGDYKEIVQKVKELEGKLKKIESYSFPVEFLNYIKVTTYKVAHLDALSELTNLDNKSKN